MSYSKAKKLFKNPKLFFFDALKKRLAPEELAKSLKNEYSQKTSPSPIKVSSKDKSSSHQEPQNAIRDLHHKQKNPLSSVQLELASDWINGKHALFPILMSYLMERTCFVQQIDTSTPDSIRIAIKSDDFSYVLGHIRNFSYNGLWLELCQSHLDTPQRTLISAYFRDENTIYYSPCIELDPWFISEKYKRIYTHNDNPTCTHLDVNYLNKTVHASNPYFLQGSLQSPEHYHLSNLLSLPPSIYENFDFDVDVVFTWVDGNDLKWQRKKNKLNETSKGNFEDTDVARYEQIDELRYALRSIASYFKDFRKIFIVTDEQIPWWLDTDNEKVVIIDHKDIFPNINYLPVFNSHAIEANLHRIPGLSKKFIYLNDDIFLWKPMDKSKFFKANGLSISRFENISNVHGKPSQHYPAWKNAALNVNNKLEEKYGVRNYSYHLHCPHSLDKDVYNDMWKEFYDELNQTSKSRFRSKEDYSPISFLYHAFSFIKGHSIKENLTEVGIYNTANSDHLDKLEKAIDNYNIDFVCINDGGQDRFTSRILNILQKKFPTKAEWELQD